MKLKIKPLNDAAREIYSDHGHFHEGDAGLDLYVLEDITIEAGEFTAIVGPSGSGKTTLLAMLAGLLTPSEGGIVINGQNLTQMNERELTRFRRENVGFTFQASNLVPYLTVQENVELMLKLNGKLNRASKARAKELLTRLGLGDRLKNLPSQLSGGQQQRVAIARALANDPLIILADEPTGNLDSSSGADILGILDRLHEEGKTLIVVTHDENIATHAQRVIRLFDGRIAEDTYNYHKDL